MSEDKKQVPKQEFPSKKAVALGYNPSRNDAPQLLAKGSNSVAEKIIDIAKKKNIPIYRSETLVNSLYLEKTGDEIPMKLYDAVAVILAYTYRLGKSNV
jgi:flagellar biosynthesis protein